MAILDRLLHHSHALKIRGDNFRLREKWRSGLRKHPDQETGLRGRQYYTGSQHHKEVKRRSTEPSSAARRPPPGPKVRTNASACWRCKATWPPVCLMVCVRRQGELAAAFPEPPVFTASAQSALVRKLLQSEAAAVEMEAELAQRTLRRPL